MPTIHVVCPKCKKKLETSSRNEGREGVCPHCESSFDLKAVGRGLSFSAANEAPEYADTVVVVLAIALAVSLLALAGTALMAWSDAAGQARAYLAGQKAGIFAGSLACAALVLLAWHGRKSLAPAALVSTGGTRAAAIWVAGTAALLKQAPLPEGIETVLHDGVYYALFAASLGFGLAGYLCFQLRDQRIFPRLPIFAAVAVFLGLMGGWIAVQGHVKPALMGSETEPAEAGEQPADEDSVRPTSTADLDTYPT